MLLNSLYFVLSWKRAFLVCCQGGVSTGDGMTAYVLTALQTVVDDIENPVRVAHCTTPLSSTLCLGF